MRKQQISHKLFVIFTDIEHMWEESTEKVGKHILKLSPEARLNRVDITPIRKHWNSSALPTNVLHKKCIIVYYN